MATGGFPDSSEQEARRRVARSLMRAGVVEMAVGVVFYVLWPVDHGASRSWNLYGGIAIAAGGLVLLGMAYRIRRSAR